MSGGASVDARNCATCGQERASVTKQEDGQTRRTTNASRATQAGYRAEPLPSAPTSGLLATCPPPGTPVAGP